MNSDKEAARIFGFRVTDSSGNKIGHVDNVWVDDVTNELEFVGVKTGRIMGKTLVIPVGRSRISDHTIELPFAEDQIKDAPSFSGDEELSPEQEEEIYSYYGDDRSMSDDSAGLPTDSDDGLASIRGDDSSQSEGTVRTNLAVPDVGDAR